ncbi:hypothetical protein WME90_11255 [Sorangium sp. So ce375]|uniref:hypothetical protein n=1 Tax=Sorangium sp. So ce375 TaxID=3133306 RepID=UPI003F5C7580
MAMAFVVFAAVQCGGSERGHDGTSAGGSGGGGSGAVSSGDGGSGDGGSGGGVGGSSANGSSSSSGGVGTDCSADCAAGRYSACSCASDDPCGWRGDGDCDKACATRFPRDHFNDAADCRTCEDVCGAVGEIVCVSGSFRTCARGDDGCLRLGTEIACDSGVCADTRSCLPYESPPEGWFCQSGRYNSGDLCDCACGAPDPDCDHTGLDVRGCGEGGMCAADGTCVIDRTSRCRPQAPPVVEPPALDVRDDVTSSNAREGAVYLRSRKLAPLRKVGALSALHEQILTRLRGFGYPGLSAEGLLYAEAPGRYDTFLPEEKALFPELWSLLEIAAPSELTAHDGLRSIRELAVERLDVSPVRLDLTARFTIEELPTEVRESARRVLKTAGAPSGTLAFGEVVTALDNPGLYTVNEYESFPKLMRAIERRALTPATIPHFEIVSDLEAPVALPVGDAAVRVERTVARQSCDFVLTNTTEIATKVTLRFDVPEGSLLVWTPLSADAVLFDRRELDATEYQVLPDRSVSALRVSYSGTAAAVALVELWRDGVRAAQRVVHVAGDELLSAEGRALVRNGEILCAPWDESWDKYVSPSRSWRLPPGTYPVPAGTYGTAFLDVFGVGVFRLRIGTQAFWHLERAGSASALNQCWSLTSGGPYNLVTCTRGEGPGLRLEHEDGRMFFGEFSTTTCAGGGGTLVATLTAADRE